jgi:signal transduction histidine kinase
MNEHKEIAGASRWPWHWLILFSALLVTAAALAFWGKPGHGLSSFGDFAELGCLVVAAVFTIRNALSSRGASRVFWSFSAAGIVLWLAGVAQWTEYEIFLRKPLPQMPIGDILLFLKLVPMVAALAAEPQTQLTGRFRVLGFLDLSFLLVYWFYFYALWVIPYRYVTYNEGIYNSHFNTIDTLGHILFTIVLGISALRAQGAWRTLYRLYWASFALYTLSSAIANVAIDNGKYYSGGFYDLPLLTAVAGIALFAVLGEQLRFSSLPSVLSREDRSSRVVELFPSRIGMLATLSTPIVGLALASSAGITDKIGRFRVLTTLFAILILSLLLFVKQDFLSRDHVRSFRVASLAYADLTMSHERLLQTEKLASLGRVVARVAGEVKKAMRVTQDSSVYLMTAPGASSVAQGTAEKILTQANRMDALLDNMLGFACESPLEITTADVSQLLSAAVGLTRASRGAVVHIGTRSEGEIPKVAADPSRILQVFVQVIGNALDAMEGSISGSLSITLRLVREQVEIEFADTGTGLSEPDHVFEPFYTTKSVGKGIGLGLSTCYGIVHQHHGVISCRNRDGGGSVFTVRLPIAHVAASTSRATYLAAVEGK